MVEFIPFAVINMLWDSLNFYNQFHQGRQVNKIVLKDYCVLQHKLICKQNLSSTSALLPKINNVF
jgi:hypothetical protein